VRAQSNGSALSVSTPLCDIFTLVFRARALLNSKGFWRWCIILRTASFPCHYIPSRIFPSYLYNHSFLIIFLLVLKYTRDNTIGIKPGYGLDDRGVEFRVPVGSRVFLSPRRPDQFWGSHSLLSIGWRRIFPRGQSGWGLKLTTHHQLVSRSRKCGSIHPLPNTSSWRSA
jgi:hypothetical protein